MLYQVLQVDERSYDAEPLSHHHPFCQVLLPARGRITLSCAGEHGWVGGGQIAVIPAGVEHRYHAEGPNRVVVADFAAECAAPVQALRRKSAFRPQDARLIALTATLQAEARSGGLRDPLVAEALLRYLVAALSAAVEPERVVGSAAAHRQVVTATEMFLQEHFRQPVTVATIAAVVGVSPSHLHRIFREVTGSTLVEHVHHLRLAAAARLLQETDQTVLAITHEVGFASQSHLSRLFTRHFGCAPGRYREQTHAAC